MQSCHPRSLAHVHSLWQQRAQQTPSTDGEGHVCLCQIIDLAAPDLAPEGWQREAAPPQGPFTDISVYELHIRDFSVSDATVPEPLRGKYGAFGLVRYIEP
jgi:pullulanase/glycogen debranching enzyme